MCYKNLLKRANASSQYRTFDLIRVAGIAVVLLLLATVLMFWVGCTDCQWVGVLQKLRDMTLFKTSEIKSQTCEQARGEAEERCVLEASTGKDYTSLQMNGCLLEDSIFALAGKNGVC